MFKFWSMKLKKRYYLFFSLSIISVFVLFIVYFITNATRRYDQKNDNLLRMLNVDVIKKLQKYNVNYLFSLERAQKQKNILQTDLQYVKVNNILPSKLEVTKLNLADLKQANYDLKLIRIFGDYKLSELKQSGLFNLKELKQAGFTFNELCDVFTAQEFKDAGFNLVELEKFIDIRILLAIGFTLSDIQKIDFKASKEKFQPFFTLRELRKAGFTLAQFKKMKYSLSELKKSNLFTAQELKKSNLFTVSELTAAGIS